MEKPKDKISPENITITPMNDTREFVGFMSGLLKGVLNDTVSPEKAKAIVGVGNAMLRALELNMEWTERETRNAAESMPFLLENSKQENEDS